MVATFHALLSYNSGKGAVPRSKLNLTLVLGYLNLQILIKTVKADLKLLMLGVTSSSVLKSTETALPRQAN